MTSEEITRYLTELNDELCAMHVKGEVSLYGGAVMCLVYDARPATKDVDAVFRPTSEMRAARPERLPLPIGIFHSGRYLFGQTEQTLGVGDCLR